jgi:hypothetical protein
MSDAYIEQKIAEHEARVYGGNMPAHNKATLRKQLEEEDRFWERDAVRVDNYTGRDDQ